MVFILGLQCGIEGAYFNRSVGAPAYAGVFAAWCDLREMVPYMFGYIMAAKVGTGIVAELGAMRINEEIDALEVMGVKPITFLAATRLLAAWMVLPFIYISAVGVGFLASYLAVVKQIGEVSSGGYFLIFWMFQNPPDLLFSVIKGMTMATAIVAVGCYYGYTASRRPGRGRPGDRQVDDPQHGAGAPDRDDGLAGLLGGQSEGADRGLSGARGRCNFACNFRICNGSFGSPYPYVLPISGVMETPGRGWKPRTPGSECFGAPRASLRVGDLAGPRSQTRR